MYKRLTGLNWVLRTTIMTPVKPQISKYQAEKSCQVVFDALRRLHSGAFVKQDNSSVLASVLYVCNTSSIVIAHGLFDKKESMASKIMSQIILKLQINCRLSIYRLVTVWSSCKLRNYVKRLKLDVFSSIQWDKKKYAQSKNYTYTDR